MGVGKVSLLRTWYSFLLRAEQELEKVGSDESKTLISEIRYAKTDIELLMCPNDDEVV